MVLEQPIVRRVDDPVALAGSCDESWPIQNVDSPTRISNYAIALKIAGSHRYCGTLNSKHLGEEFLGKVKHLRLRPVS